MSKQLALNRQALRGALDVRSKAGIPHDRAICIYDVVERLGVEVRFYGGGSFGGMYVKSSNTIVVPSLRPPGRQAFTCGHELGHWYFGHGTRIQDADLMARSLPDDPQERMAHSFSASLLMPPWAVKRVLAARSYDPGRCTALDIYRVAGQLGVGYSTLIRHLQYQLTALTYSKAEQLMRKTPKEIRLDVLGNQKHKHMIIADRAWTDVPIDIRQGDIAIIPSGATLEGKSAAITGENRLGLIVEGITPGLSRAETSDGAWAVFIRVSRDGYEGRSIYRHLEDDDVEDDASHDL